jgi:hypothetical protein
MDVVYAVIHISLVERKNSSISESINQLVAAVHFCHKTLRSGELQLKHVVDIFWELFQQI